MGAEADDRNVVLVAVRRDGRVDIAMLVEMRIGDADLEQFLDQQAAEILLLLGRRLGRGFGVGLGIDDDVTEETVGNADGHGRIQTAKGPFCSGARPSREWGICLRSRDGQGWPGGAAASPAAGCGSRTGAKIAIGSLRPARGSRPTSRHALAIRRAFHGGAGGQDHLAIALRRLLQTRGDVHRVAQHRELHPLFVADDAAEHLADMDPDPDPHRMRQFARCVPGLDDPDEVMREGERARRRRRRPRPAPRTGSARRRR